MRYLICPFWKLFSDIEEKHLYSYLYSIIIGELEIEQGAVAVHFIKCTVSAHQKHAKYKVHK